MDINLLIPDYGYEFEDHSVLIDKADSARNLQTSYNEEGSTNPYLGENSVNRVREFKLAIIENFKNTYGTVTMSFPHSSYAHLVYKTGAGAPEGTHFLTIIEEPTAQRLQVYMTFNPICLGDPIIEKAFTREFNSLPGLQVPTPNYANGVEMPNGIPIQYDSNWPLDIKNKYWYAQECNRRSLSETEVLNAFREGNINKGLYKEMYRQALAKQNQYLFNRDSIISELERNGIR